MKKREDYRLQVANMETFISKDRFTKGVPCKLGYVVRTMAFDQQGKFIAHTPLWVYDKELNQWYGLEDNYYLTDKLVMEKTKPDAEIRLLPAKHLKSYINAGSYAGYVASRVCGET